jgi:chromate reductase
MSSVIKKTPPYTVGFFIGSLSTQSINRKLARALIRLAPDELNFTEIIIKDLPLYNRDFDVDFPAVAREFKASIQTVDALLFVTPENNRSVPGVLKNAIDWASRPYGENVIAGKPTAVIGASPGAIGTAIAQQNLRSILGFLTAPQMNSPEAYITMTPELIADNGEVTNDGTRDFLQGYMTSFFEHIERAMTVVSEPHRS